MSNWTHPQCVPCWAAANPGREAYRLVLAEPETCCWCGQQAEAGIYVRADPAVTPRCTRDHGD